MDTDSALAWVDRNASDNDFVFGIRAVVAARTLADAYRAQSAENARLKRQIAELTA